jgi:hypothetical protein
MDTPTSFIPHEQPLVGVDELNDFSTFFLHSFPFHVVSVVCLCGETKPGMQETKLILFWTAHGGLQNCMLCQNYSAGQVVNTDSLASALRK